MGGGRKWTDREREIFQVMSVAGRSYSEIAERLGKSYQSIRMYAKRKENPHYGEGASQMIPTKCWGCRYATGRVHPRTNAPCPWTESPPAPVDGWKILSSGRREYKGKTQTGVVVIDCPLFAEG